MGWECISSWIELHPGLASWVQAVGSIAAIGAAAVFPALHERARAKQVRRNTLSSLLHLANRLEELEQLAGNALAEEVGRVMWIALKRSQEVRLVTEIVDELPPSMFVGFEMTYLAELRTCSLHLQGLAEDIEDNEWSTLRYQHSFDEMVRSQKSHLEMLQSVSYLIGNERRSL